jgi:hypothetical protein
MDLEDVLKVAPAVGVVIGLGIYSARQKRAAAAMSEKIRAELSGVDSLALPELVTRLGFKDGFYNRGKVMNVINPMVTAGEILSEEPPGTTIADRLSVLRFRLRAKPVA